MPKTWSGCSDQVDKLPRCSYICAVHREPVDQSAVDRSFTVSLFLLFHLILQFLLFVLFFRLPLNPFILLFLSLLFLLYFFLPYLSHCSCIPLLFVSSIYCASPFLNSTQSSSTCSFSSSTFLPFLSQFCSPRLLFFLSLLFLLFIVPSYTHLLG